MTRGDGAVQAMIDELHPFGTVGREGRTVAAWVSAHDVDGTGAAHRAIGVAGVTGAGIPFAALSRGTDGPGTAEASLAAPGQAKPATWMRLMSRWRNEERAASRILAGHEPNLRQLPNGLREFAIAVERHARSVRGVRAKLAEGAHAVLRRMEALEVHARSALAPDLARFVIGKEPALAYREDWFARFGGDVLEACLAEPHAWQELEAYARKAPERFWTLAAGKRFDTLAHEALLAAGMPAGLARRAREASDAMAGLAVGPVDPFLGIYHAHQADNGASRLVPAGMAELADYPANWLPRDVEGWRAALTLVQFLTRDKAVKQAHRDPASLVAVVDAGGDWTGYRGRLAKASRMRDLDGILTSIGGLDDMCDAFRDQVVDTALALDLGLGQRAGVEETSRAVPRRQRTRFARAFLLSGRNLVGMLEDGAAWHAVQDGIADDLRFGPHGLSEPSEGWAPWFPDMTAGDIRLTVLADRASLKAEGGSGPDADGIPGMDHCVGNYAARCLSHGTRVASVRRMLPGGGFERLATVELAMSGREAVAIQCRGRSNGAPPPEAARMVDAYLDSLREGLIHVDRGASATRRDRMPNVASACGYRWWEEGAWEAARSMWSPLLPRHLRDVDAPALVASLRRDAEANDGLWWRPDRYETAEAEPAPSPGP